MRLAQHRFPTDSGRVAGTSGSYAGRRRTVTDSMDYKLLGNSGLRVSELALGTMTLSTDNPWGWGVERQPSLEILETYADAGGNFIDTACNYTDGQSEQVVGEFVAHDRDAYVIATKYTLHEHGHEADPNYGGNHRKNLRRTVEGSLDRLGTDYVDVLYLHVWDYTTPIEEVMATLHSLVTEGTVHYLAISDTPAWVVAQANQLAADRGWTPFVAYQFPYNVERRGAEREVLPYCRYNDVAMVPWSVLGSGLYTGKYTQDADAAGRIADREFDEDALRVPRLVDEIAEERGVTAAQVAIAWARAQDQQLFPIVGATATAHVSEAIAATDVELGPDTLERLDDAVAYDHGFPQDFLGSENVRELVHGETADRLENHRFRGY